MTDLALFPELMPEEQFRAVRLQVHNWGTFSGCNDIPIAEEGFLFVGASGSGKATLLDAFSQLLIPPRWVDFNAAAHETGGKVKGDRSIVSYVRGAWSELQTDAGVTTQYLREETTASGLALTFRNARRIVKLLLSFSHIGIVYALLLAELFFHLLPGCLGLVLPVVPLLLRRLLRFYGLVQLADRHIRNVILSYKFLALGSR